MKIAIVGTGISGLGAAYMLHPRYDITVYEKNDYIGGHGRTVDVKTADGTVPIDTGFIVFNFKNYPLLSSLFKHLKVPIAKSSMSFGVSFNKGWLEYGTQNFFSIFAQKRNLLRLAFWQMLSSILRFNRKSHKYLNRNSSLSLGECLDRLNMNRWFREYYLLAMGAAIWSTPLNEMLNFPAETFIRFFDNHGLLTISDRPQWYTVVGGSREYIHRLTCPFRDTIKLNCGVQRVIRHNNNIEVIDTQGDRTRYDHVIFACHPDQALALLENHSSEEKAIIGIFRYQPNQMSLHSDISFMPRCPKAWSSWVYLSENCHDDDRSAVSLSYWMNSLQPLGTKVPFISTLNPRREPDAALTHDRYIFEHPVFDKAAIDAQKKLSIVQGKTRVWYCGAWQRYGFHEDGLLSAVNVAKQLGADVSWA